MNHAFFVTSCIAGGKSTFVKIANNLGFKSISADKIAHEILNLYSDKIARMFQCFNKQNLTLLNNDKTVNRKALGQIVFSNAKAKALLENFTHPKIRAEILRQIQILEQENKIFFIEVPLLFESKAYENLGKTIVINTSKKLLLERLMKRDKLSKAMALKKINSQIDIKQKVKKADIVIDNYNYEDFMKKSIETIKKLNSIKIYKYFVNGNDFVIINSNKEEDYSKLAKELCNRYSGVGADGFIVILPHEKYAFKWLFYNNDGSLASMCGNGARAASHFAVNINKASSKLEFLTEHGVIKASVLQDEVEISINKIKQEKLNENLYLCDTGVSHLVIFTDDLNKFDLKICQKLRHKYNANVNFAQIINDKTIKVRTFERGVENETLACGTGMCACFYLAFLEQKVKNQATVIPKSQESVKVKFKNDELYLKGKVRQCFEANYYFM